MASPRLRVVLGGCSLALVAGGCSLLVDTSDLSGGTATQGDSGLGDSFSAGDSLSPNDSLSPGDTSPGDANFPETSDVLVDPPTVTVLAFGAVAFHANQSVTWSVLESGGGSISGSGIYTAPGAPGAYTVRASSTVNANLHADAIVTVKNAVVPGTIAQVGNMGTATGHGSQTKLVRAADTGEWWLFFNRAGDTLLRTTHSTNFSTWTEGETLALPKGHAGDGRDLSVAFRALNGHDVVHVTQGYDSGGVIGRYHVRAVLTAGHATFGIAHEINSGGDSKPDGSSTTILADGTVIDSTGWQDTPRADPLTPCGNGDVDNYESQTADDGTTDFDAITFKDIVLWCVPSYVKARQLLVVGQDVFHVYADGIDSESPVNLLVSHRSSNGIWLPQQTGSTAISPPKAFPVDASIGLDDWSAAVQGQKVHIVRRTSVGFDHGTIDTTGAVAVGGTIPNQATVANSGLYVAPYGAGLVLAALASDGSVKYTAFDGTTWSNWATLVPALPGRNFIAGAAPDGVPPAVIWTEQNASVFVIAGALLP